MTEPMTKLTEAIEAEKKAKGMREAYIKAEIDLREAKIEAKREEKYTGRSGRWDGPDTRWRKRLDHEIKILRGGVLPSERRVSDLPKAPTTAAGVAAHAEHHVVPTDARARRVAGGPRRHRGRAQELECHRRQAARVRARFAAAPR